MKLACITLVLLSVLAASIHGKDSSAELTTLTAKFHDIINELGKGELNTNAYESETAALLRRLERFHYPGAPLHQNISLDWFSGSFVQAAPLRIFLVVSSFEGMYLNSGIGTFYAALSDFLVNHGHSVTILYTRTDGTDTTKTFLRWQANYAKRGIAVVRLDPISVHVSSPSLTQKSYQVYEYLKARQGEFDVVHFPDWEGPGYFSILARHQRLAFSSHIFVVGLHGPWRWVKHGNEHVGLTEPEDFETDWLERRSVELADFVVTPSVDLPNWLASQGWDVVGDDDAQYHKLSLMPFLPGREIQMINQRQPVGHSNQKMKVVELVFFGRLETRKGVGLFADALDLLSQRVSKHEQLRITFMGRSADIEGQTSTKYISERADKGKWPFKLTFATHKDRKAALDYMKDGGRGRLAVIPSLIDNAPYTIYECLYSGVPFIASDLPSVAALIEPADRAAVLFAIEAEALADKIEQIIDQGATTARGLVSADESVRVWEAFYNMMSLRMREPIPEAPLQEDLADKPLVSVCITHFNRPELLAMALQSVEAQDYSLSNIEVVLVDDGSTDASALSYLDSLEENFKKNNWQIVRTENKYLGAARNTAARAARGEYIVFLDDDNFARPNQVSTYVSVARATGADVLTAAHDVFRGYGLPRASPPDSNVVSRSLPLGPAIALGVFKNCFGDANFFIKRHVFEQTGGFTEEKSVGNEDYEFLADAVLSGLHMEAIAEPLLYYRMHNQSEQMMYATDPIANQVRSVRPFKAVMDDESTETSETLTLLARRHSLRYAQDTPQRCNLTIIDVYPTTIKLLTRTNITFTAAHTPPCQISDIRIGSYSCSSISQTPDDTTFRCLSPALPFPGNYSITIKFVGSTDSTRTLQQIVVQKAAVNTSVAAVMIKYLADLSLYKNSTELFNLFAALGGFSADALRVIDDLIVQATQNKRNLLAATAEYAGVERHDMRFALTSSSSTETATDVALRLIRVSLANRDRFTAIGVTILDFNLIGTCDENLNCDCTPSYSGEGCGDDAQCPNDCTSKSQGTCVDGPYRRLCSCYPGYTGRDCSIPTCTNECSGHGACRLSAMDQPQCICDKGWEGSSCDEVQPCPNNCSGAGTCVEGVCKCKSGRSGDDCRSDDNLSKDNSKSGNDRGTTIGLSIAAAVAGIALITAVVLFVHLRRLKR